MYVTCHSPGNASRSSCRACGLRRVCLPATLEDVELERLDAIIRHGRRLRKGEHLFHEGDPMQHVYALRAGSLKTYLRRPDGGELITGFTFPGELIGLDALDTERSHSHAMALEPTTVCVIPLARFEALAQSIPQLRNALVKGLSRELHVEQVHLSHSRESAGQRLIAFLLGLSARQSRRGSSASRLALPMTRAEIGNHLGLTTETVSRMFSRYRAQGLITCNGRYVELVDLHAMMRHVEASTRQPRHRTDCEPLSLIGQAGGKIMVDACQ